MQRTHLRRFDDIDRQQTQTHLQAVLKEMQEQGVPRTPRIDPPALQVPALLKPRKTDKLPELHQKTDFEGWLDRHIYEFWQAKHTFPHTIFISSIRKLEFIVEQLERQESAVRWNEYVFRHTHGWITIKLETKIMGYHEAICE